ncbi:MAG: hypothetical protein RJB66_808 [Pseudomonadota bacterium]|jgi:mono/diheme cytochrome c family protein
MGQQFNDGVHMKIFILLGFLVSSFAFASDNAAGEKLFVTNCSMCHGVDGKGQTDTGKALKARNFVTDDFKQVKDKKKGPTEEDIMNTLKTGVPGTGMAPFAHLPESDRKALAKYVLTLRKAGKK